MTVTVWNMDTSTAVAHPIEHDRNVFDAAWLPQLDGRVRLG